MDKDEYIRTDGERKAAEIWAERETILPIEKEKHPLFFMFGIILYFSVAMVLLLFFEVKFFYCCFVLI